MLVENPGDQIRMQIYRGFSSERYTFIKGRFVTGEVEPVISLLDGRWRNLINNKRRFLIKGVPGINGSIIFLGNRLSIISDERGFFNVQLANGATPIDNQEWLDIIIEIPLLGINSQISDILLLPDRNAQYGIITDIDDTVVHTGVSNKFKMVLKTIFTNAYLKNSITGANELYNHFHVSNDGITNPVFYVSRSPWNLYDMLQDFFSHNHFPKGPLILRDPSTQRDNPKAGLTETHKYKAITNILAAYPELPFILMGDSTEIDAVIYLELKEIFKDRIKQIYIREVEDSKNLRNLQAYAKNHKLGGDSIFFFKQYDEIHAHALAKGYFSIAKH